MFISKMRFEEEVNKRVEKAALKAEESHWQREKEDRKVRYIDELQRRLIECEKKCGIDHPSHHRDESCYPSWW